MKTIQLNLYNFNELDKSGRKKAIEHFRDINLVCDWWDFQLDDFVNLCKYLGIAVDKDTIQFLGFYCPGSGSGFYAEVDFKALIDGISAHSWKTYAPALELNLFLPAIDHRVLKLVLDGKIDIQARIIRRNKCYGVIADLGGYPVEAGGKEHDLIYGEIDELEKWLERVAKTLNEVLFTSLEDQYDHLSDDASIEVAIIANDYLFMADGTFARQVEKLAII